MNSSFGTSIKYVTIAQAAEILNQSVKTVRRRISDGTLPAYRVGPRLIRVRVEDLDASCRRIPSARPRCRHRLGWPHLRRRHPMHIRCRWKFRRPSELH
jgi:excisionase family DNA binding protein